MFLTFSFFPQSSQSQEVNLSPSVEQAYQEVEDGLRAGKLMIQATFGMTIELGARNYGSFRTFLGLGLLKDIAISTENPNLIAGFQTDIEIYRGGMGASLLSNDNAKINIDWRNQITLTGGVMKEKQFIGAPAFLLMGDSRSSFFNPFTCGFTVGTMFINGINHQRNQQIGGLAINLYGFNFQYVNDYLFNVLPLVDNYDRYWTGAGQIGYYWKNDRSLFTDFTLRFDNYTGYQPNLYETASLLHLDYLPYSDHKQQTYNKARFQYRLGIQNYTSINWNAYEALMDIQNLIHFYASESPFHPRTLGKRYLIGVDYQYYSPVK